MAVLGIRGWVKLPSPQLFENAVAVIGLDDVSRIDAPAVRVVQTLVESIHGIRDRIPFALFVEEGLLVGKSYVVAAEVRRHSHGALRRGDFITTAAFPWYKNYRGDIVLEVKQV